jgi:hypothetical protein
MTAQILSLVVGLAAAGFIAQHDYRQTRTPDSLLGALLTFGLFASVALALGPQA